MGKKRKIILNTLILTLSGLIARILGFFYRIYLSNVIGAEGLGLYQLAFPVFILCFTFCSSGIQSSMSRMAATCLANNNTKKLYKTFRMNFIATLFLSIGVGILLWLFAPYIGVNWLGDVRTVSCLQIFAFAIPVTCTCSLCSGFFYGINMAGIPAIAQVSEQIIRVLIVFFMVPVIGHYSAEPNYLPLIIAALAISEGISCVIGLTAYHFVKKKKLPVNASCRNTTYMSILKEMSSIAVPITLNRFSVTILGTVETILIPMMLVASGMTSTQALEVYGTLIGMAIPFIVFPSTFTHSLSVMLMPHVAEAHASNSQQTIRSTSAQTVKFCLYAGILSIFVFVYFGNAMGISIFNNTLAGKFIVTMAWLCPFMYLSHTLSSILNGLGKVNTTLMISMIGTSISLAFVLFVIPVTGIQGYMYGMLLSSVITCALYLYHTLKETHMTLDVAKWICFPAALCFMITKAVNILMPLTNPHNILSMLMSIAIITGVYLGLLGIIEYVSYKRPRRRHTRAFSSHIT